MSGEGPVDLILVVLCAVAIVLAFLGAVGALQGGAPYATSQNAWDVPRWAPAAVSLALLAVALSIWSSARIFRLLALFWSVAAAGFARPGLREIGLEVRLEMVSLVFGVGLAILALSLREDRTVKAAMWAAFAAPLVAAAAVALPDDWPVEWPAYATILALAALSARARWIHRRTAS